ncbi:MAG: DNA glycosylase AlkZ-like family protein, partial [Candidatus Rokuibacteriota bacterium]
MTHPVFPLRAVAALFLERQHLTRPRARRLSPSRLTRFIEDVGGLQMDSINVLDRAHYLTVWSRFGPYDRARLDRLVYCRRLFLEYWAHAACLVPASMLPWWKRAMLDYRLRHTGWSNWLRRNTRLLALVTETIRANGPMGHAEMEARRPRRGDRGWWNWRPVQHAIHYLWMTGALTVHSRRHFQKRFDLMERV